MAYTHGKYTVIMSTSGLDSNAASGVLGWKWTPGFVPHVVRAVGVLNTSTLTLGDAYVAQFERVVGSSATTATGFATLNGGSSAITKGQVLYKGDLNVQINPGDEVYYHITTVASAAVLLQPFMYVEPKWEVPGNATGQMQATT